MILDLGAYSIEQLYKMLELQEKNLAKLRTREFEFKSQGDSRIWTVLWQAMNEDIQKIKQVIAEKKTNEN